MASLSVCVHVEAHRRGVEFDRVVRLQPGGLVGDERVGGGVALVEAVARELVDQVEQLVGLGGRDGIDPRAALDEAGALGVHLRLDLLAHGAAQQIGLAEAEAGEHLGRLHHLLLVDEDAVGLLQHLLEQRMGIFDRLAAVLAGAEHRDIVHRAGPVERDERDDVAEIVRLHRRQRAPHPLRFELEHADRLAALEEGVDLGIVPGDAVEIDVDAARGQHLDRFPQHGQGLQAEKVELHQPRGLDIFHVELGHRHVRARIAVERDELVERAVGDDHAGGMGRGVARQTFELHCQIEQPADLAVVLIIGGELGDPVQRPLQSPRVGRVVGDQFGQPVDLAVGHLQDAAGILEHGTRLQFPEGDDLGDAVGTPALLDVADHLAAPRFAKVDVEIRHRHALGIEEALEQEAQPDRIEIGDGQRPGDHRAGARAAARADWNALLLGPFDEVGDDQEIAGKAHAGDDVDLEFEAVGIGLAVGLAEIARSATAGRPARSARRGGAARPRFRGRPRCAAGSACAGAR